MESNQNIIINKINYYQINPNNFTINKKLSGQSSKRYFFYLNYNNKMNLCTYTPIFYSRPTINKNIKQYDEYQKEMIRFNKCMDDICEHFDSDEIKNQLDEIIRNNEQSNNKSKNNKPKQKKYQLVNIANFPKTKKKYEDDKEDEDKIIYEKSKIIKFNIREKDDMVVPDVFVSNNNEKYQQIKTTLSDLRNNINMNQKNKIFPHVQLLFGLNQLYVSKTQNDEGFYEYGFTFDVKEIKINHILPDINNQDDDNKNHKNNKNKNKNKYEKDPDMILGQVKDPNLIYLDTYHYIGMYEGRVLNKMTMPLLIKQEYDYNYNINDSDNSDDSDVENDKNDVQDDDVWNNDDKSQSQSESESEDDEPKQKQKQKLKLKQKLSSSDGE